MVKMILLAFAFVCFVLAALGVPSSPNPPKFNLTAMGLAFLTASMIFPL